MVNVTAGRCNTRWFGVAWSGETLVATAVAPTRDKAFRFVTRYVPRFSPLCAIDEPTPFVAEVVAMLNELENGNEQQKRYTRSGEYLSGPMYRIYTAAAAIPIGYVTTYGDIAKTAGSEARAVGRAMATNPLYPVVPCHRVVGADMSLVGYGGKQDPPALAAKLARIAAEALGALSDMEIAVNESMLKIYPAERVIHATRETANRRAEADRLEYEKAAADRLQLPLF